MLKRGKKITSVVKFNNRIKNDKGMCYSSDLTINGRPTKFYTAQEAKALPFAFLIDTIQCGYWYEANEVE
jgi:hypothetical protein